MKINHHTEEIRDRQVGYKRNLNYKASEFKLPWDHVGQEQEGKQLSVLRGFLFFRFATKTLVAVTLTP